VKDEAIAKSIKLLQIDFTLMLSPLNAEFNQNPIAGGQPAGGSTEKLSRNPANQQEL
jgi:hypothetical protein